MYNICSRLEKDYIGGDGDNLYNTLGTHNAIKLRKGVVKCVNCVKTNQEQVK